MRKVLLATTALVALNISAASADVSISGTGTFEIVDTTSTTFASDGNIVIKGSTTTDSGLTLSAVQDIKFEGENDASTSINAQIADSYIDIAGDFGSLRMGNTDDALDRMDGVLPANMDLEGIGASGVGTAIGGDSVNVSYVSPSFNGITVYGTTTANGDSTGFGANYKTGGIHVMYQAEDDGTNTSSVIGGSFTAGPVTVAAGARSSKAGTTTTKYTDVGASYTIGDIKVVATSQKQDTNKYSNIGVAYSVAPGFAVKAENGSQGSTNATWVSLEVSF
jgi:outer membrane protein OmpU